jgi:ABC-type multidrug transport system permease subunit
VDFSSFPVAFILLSFIFFVSFFAAAIYLLSFFSHFSSCCSFSTLPVVFLLLQQLLLSFSSPFICRTSDLIEGGGRWLGGSGARDCSNGFCSGEEDEHGLGTGWADCRDEQRAR